MKKQTKRNSLIVGAALALMVAVGATAGQTFAKYTTSGEATGNTATVAKWGFTVQGETGKLFGSKYEVGGAVSNKNADAAEVIVVGASNVVAPGTNGYFDIKVNGQAEVDAELTVTTSGKFETVALFEKGEEIYSPIVWKLTNGTNTVTIDNTKFADATEGIAAQLAKWSTRIEAGTSYDEETNGLFKLEWEWPWSEDDAKDTILGQLADDETKMAAGTDYAGTSLKITIPTVTISVTQVNTASSSN